MEVLSPEMAAIKVVESIPPTIQFSDFSPGYTLTDEGIIFRLYAPKAEKVELEKRKIEIWLIEFGGFRFWLRSV